MEVSDEFRYAQLESGDQYRRDGYWLDDTFVTHVDNWADSTPSRPYVSDDHISYTYAGFRAAAWNLAATFAELGVVACDRIIVQLPNWPEYFVVYAACARVGAIIVPIVPVYRHDEVRYIVEQTQAVGIVSCGEFRHFDHSVMAADIARAAPSVAFRITVRAGAESGALSLAHILGSSRKVDGLPAPGPDDGHLLLFSSGTESRPKGCLHTWNTSAFLPRQAVAALGMTADDVVFMPSPVTHTLGLTLGVLAPTLAGTEVQLLDVFEPDAALRRISEHKCTGGASPAPLIQMMVDAYDPERHDLSALRFWLTAGAPISPSLVHDVTAKFGCRLVSAYGASEIMMATVCRPEDPVERAASSDGAPVAGVQLRIVTDGEEDAPEGVDGEIRYVGPGRMIGYWRNPELTKTATDDRGWWKTGDLGRVDADGYLRVTGRAKDIIIRGGHNISAREVEDALADLPTISSVAVIGIPDKKLGERLCAMVVPMGDSVPTIDDLRVHLTEVHHLAIWRYPSGSSSSPSSLPRPPGRCRSSCCAIGFAPSDQEERYVSNSFRTQAFRGQNNCSHWRRERNRPMHRARIERAGSTCRHRRAQPGQTGRGQRGDHVRRRFDLGLRV